MPPTHAHFNGSVNLPDAETVMREIAARVPQGVRRIPDGETGDRQAWIFFQMQKFAQTPGLVQVEGRDMPAEGYEQMPQLRLAEGASAADVRWPDLGYADAYLESYGIFSRLRDADTIPAGVRFQMEYPTPLASIASWIAPEEQDALLDSYELALFEDLARALRELPHDRVAVQWDVAVEFGLLEGGFSGSGTESFDEIVEALARCVDSVPADVPVGLHLCYGDHEHQHFVQPASLELQVRVATEVSARASRPVSWLSFTVPQDERRASYFEPLRELSVDADTELYFALVPYHPTDQPTGTTAEQVRLLDSALASSPGGLREWGICTECGMARAERDETPVLLDAYREILAAHAVT